MQIIAVANQKGGVGKTTTAVNLAASLAASDYRTLLIDLDPQANASSSIGVFTDEYEPTSNIYRTLIRMIESGSSAPQIISTKIGKLDLIPGTLDSAAAEHEFVEIEDAHYLVAKLIRQIDEARSPEVRYDFIVLDTPPSIGLLTVNALSAANKLIIPVQSEYLALEGLGLILRTLERVQSDFNPALDQVFILITMFDARLKLSKAVEHELRQKISEIPGIKVCRTMIPRSVKLAEAPSHGMPVMMFDPASTGASAYIHLAKEVLGYEETGIGERDRPAPAEEEAPVSTPGVPPRSKDTFID